MVRFLYINNAKTLHWNGKVVRLTALVFTGDVEDKLQRLQWIPGLSPWWPFHFCVLKKYRRQSQSSISHKTCTLFGYALFSCGYSRSSWLCFYQTRLAWSVDQGSNKNHSSAYNFAPTVTKFCVVWEGLSLPHDTKCGNCRCKILDSRAFPSWSLIHGSRWSGLIKAEPGWFMWTIYSYPSGLLDWHVGNTMIVPVPVNWSWRIGIKSVAT